MAALQQTREGDRLWGQFFLSAFLGIFAVILGLSNLGNGAIFCSLLAVAVMVQLVTQLRTGFALQAGLIARYHRATHPGLYRFNLILLSLVMGGFIYGAISFI